MPLVVVVAAAAGRRCLQLARSFANQVSSPVALVGALETLAFHHHRSCHHLHRRPQNRARPLVAAAAVVVVLAVVGGAAVAGRADATTRPI